VRGGEGGERNRVNKGDFVLAHNKNLFNVYPHSNEMYKRSDEVPFMSLNVFFSRRHCRFVAFL
jgi:hypothetical protein